MADRPPRIDFALPATLDDLAGVDKVEQLLTYPDCQLVIDATKLRRIDAYAAVTIRAAIERLVERSPKNEVTIVPPNHEETKCCFLGLLGDLPAQCDADSLDGNDVPPAIYVPCRRVLGEEARSATYRELAENYDRRRDIRFDKTIEALGVFLHNVVTHAADSDVDAVCAVYLNEHPGHVQVVAVDTGSGICDNGNSRAELHGRVLQSLEEQKNLWGLLHESVDGCLRFVSGDARLRWEPSGIHQFPRKEGRHFAGLLASYDVVV